MKALLRGLQVMAAVFGWQFTLAIVGVMALLIGAVWFQYGVLAALIALVIALLAIRAHDIGLDAIERDEDVDPHAYAWQGVDMARDPDVLRIAQLRVKAIAGEDPSPDQREDYRVNLANVLGVAPPYRAKPAASLIAHPLGGNHPGSEL